VHSIDLDGLRLCNGRGWTYLATHAPTIEEHHAIDNSHYFVYEKEEKVDMKIKSDLAEVLDKRLRARHKAKYHNQRNNDHQKEGASVGIHIEH